MCITESLHSTAETNKIVNQLDSSKKKFIFRKAHRARESPAVCHTCTRQCWEGSVFAQGGTGVNPEGPPQEDVSWETASLPQKAVLRA